ncbi:MAG TPA: hypothetical protein VEZ90_10580, partial [Blastocatellia bacterium]|nr:hypothetical protein [Blastocatellia bacterium]
ATRALALQRQELQKAASRFAARSKAIQGKDKAKGTNGQLMQPASGVAGDSGAQSDRDRILSQITQNPNDPKIAGRVAQALYEAARGKE